jgi:hypothetical protein
VNGHVGDRKVTLSLPACGAGFGYRDVRRLVVKLSSGRAGMRQINRRLVIAGAVLIVAAIGFFFFMGGMAPRSNDPKALMETVGEVSGVAGAIGAVMMVFGFRGRKPA